MRILFSIFALMLIGCGTTAVQAPPIDFTAAAIGVTDDTAHAELHITIMEVPMVIHIASDGEVICVTAPLVERCFDVPGSEEE